MALLVLLALPAAARGQTPEEPGLDLTQPPAKPAQGETQRPQPTASEPKPKEPKGTGPETRAAASPEAPLAPGERDVALGDRVKAVQRKGFLKRHRLELGLSLPGTLNDAFYTKLGMGGKLAYNLEDSFALGVRGAYFWQLKSSHVREGKLAFSSQLLTSQLYGVGMVDGIWSPVYGKVAWLGSRIVHFDLYLLAGFGAVWTATSVAPRSEGPHLATDFGGGIRFYPGDWLALDAGLVATFYPDQPITSVPSTMQKVVAGQLGVTIFFPFSFGYTQ